MNNKTISQQKVFIIIGFIMIAIISGIIAFIYFRKEKIPVLQKNVNTAKKVATNVNFNTNVSIYVYQPTEADKKYCAQTKEEPQCLEKGSYKWTQDIGKEVLSKQDIALCGKLVYESEIQGCKFALALKTKDASICDDVNNPEGCKESVVREMKDWQACKKNSDPQKINFCYHQLLSYIISRLEEKHFCDTVTKEDQGLCRDILYFELAQASVDYNVCKKISHESGVQKCLEALPLDSDADGLPDSYEEGYYFTDPKKADTDEDGLNDKEEIFQYQTNPLKSDSDNDGYLDGVEVRTGHDPLR